MTNDPARSIHYQLVSGFTLVELLIVVVIITIIVLIVIAAINPIEQLHRSVDSANQANAEHLLSAVERSMIANDNRFPAIEIVDDTNVCESMVSKGPVYKLDAISSDLSDWFIKQINEPGYSLYMGSLLNRIKVCYQVKSVKNINLVDERGCSDGYMYFNCVPY